MSLLRLTDPKAIRSYLTDASQFSGKAQSVFLAENEKEICEILKEANQKKIPVTVSGGRTGLTGAAVPETGWVLSTEKLSRIQEIRKDPLGKDSWARLEPAIFLKDLDRTLQKESLFYPPDPTGPKAFLGGTLATNASGPNSFKYGATRSYVRRVRVVLANGEILDLRRGQIRADSNNILEIPLQGKKLRVPVPHYSLPKVKHAGGYFASPQMDAVDQFIGSEGTLGVVTEIEVSLLPRPASVMAFVVFLRSEEEAWRLAKKIREARIRNQKGGIEAVPGGAAGGGTNPEETEARILEYFDSGSLEFMRPKFAPIPKEAQACLFIEQEIIETRHATSLQEKWRRLFDAFQGVVEIWQGETPEKQEEFRNFRSALPLAIREFLSEHQQIKIGTDTCVPAQHFEKLMLYHRRGVQRLNSVNVTFGHIGESHVHLNLFPRSEGEAEKARALYPKLIQKAVELGGTFSAEHGVGKLKKTFLRQFYGLKAIEEMKAVKRVLDPNGILGRGNLFEVE